MSVDYFTRLERSEESAPAEDFISNLRFNADGLIPVVAQRAGDGAGADAGVDEPRGAGANFANGGT